MDSSPVSLNSEVRALFAMAATVCLKAGSEARWLSAMAAISMGAAYGSVYMKVQFAVQGGLMGCRPGTAT